MPTVNRERLLRDLRELRQFGASETHPLGVVRPSFSDDDLASRRWLLAKFEEAGLVPAFDGVGNAFGRSPNSGPALLVGSHSDTQPRGGWLDGAMGVIYGLECARALAEDPATAHLAVDVCAWTDEESSFLGMVGSKSFVGLLPDGAVETARSIGVLDESGGVKIEAGEPLLDALARNGLADAPRLEMEDDRYLGFFEAHIEQGPWLEARHKQIGVVTSCVGIDGVVVSFVGAQNHAGTTPMALRADAGLAAIRLASRIDAAFESIKTEDSVWNIGKLTISPGAASIVSGEATLTLQFRDPSNDQQARFRATAVALIEEAKAEQEQGRQAIQSEGLVKPVVKISSEWRAALPAAAMAEGLMCHVQSAAEHLAPGRWQRMPSGAGHDAQTFARVMPAAMLFVPSINGLSHVFDENTCDDDLVLGCEVYTEAAVRMLQCPEMQSLVGQWRRGQEIDGVATVAKL